MACRHMYVTALHLVHEGGLSGDGIFVEHRLLRLAEHETKQLLGPHDTVHRLGRSAAPRRPHTAAHQAHMTMALNHGSQNQAHMLRVAVGARFRK